VKWAALIVVLTAIAPLSWWLRQNPREIPKLLMLLGFLPFGTGVFHLYMATISWAEWPGYVKGAEVSLLDALALAVYLSFPGTRHPLPFRFSMALYFLAVLLSLFQTQVPMATFFYAWQLARMFLVYAAVTRACAADPRAAPAFLKGMVLGLFMEAGVASWERIALGVVQTGGTTGHQNLLGLMSHFVAFPSFALLLASQAGWQPLAGTLAGLAVQVMTTSRATLGLGGLGYAVVFVLSALRGWTTRKTLVLLLGAAAIAMLAPAVQSSFDRRFAAEGSSDYDERGALEKAAAMVLSDYPLGVGANLYVIVANTQGYNSTAGVAPTTGSGSANVHNVYWLVAAETGYVGLITFVLFLLRPMMVAFLCGLRHRGDPRGDLLLGLGVALLVVYVHSFFEWIFVTFHAQYMLAMEFGLVAGLAQQLGYWPERSPLFAFLTKYRFPATGSRLDSRPTAPTARR
jgi:O-Antigen ligase